MNKEDVLMLEVELNFDLNTHNLQKQSFLSLFVLCF